MNDHVNPNAGTMSQQTQLETTATLANAIGLTEMIFNKISGREISNLDHHDTGISDLIAASINKHISGK